MADRTCIEDGCDLPWYARRLCQRHYGVHWSAGTLPPKLPTPSNMERFQASCRPLDNGCIEWTGQRHFSGYGLWWADGRTVRVHRWIYQATHGPLDRSVQLDHICHDPAACDLGAECPHRRCVNVDHLRPSTAWENTLRSNAASAINARKTHCKWGHEFSVENTRYTKEGHRICVECARKRCREAAARRYAQQKAER